MSLMTPLQTSPEAAPVRKKKIARNIHEDTPDAVASPPHSESSAQAQQSPTEPIKKKRRREAVPVEELEVDLTAPEPLSKADIRAARKKSKRDDQKGHSTNDGDKGDKMNEKGDAQSKKKKQNSIWIGNLSYKTTNEALQDFVQKGIGELGGDAEGSVTRVNLPKKAGHGDFSGNMGSVQLK